MKKFLIALPVRPNARGFHHQTILVRATDRADAIDLVKHLRPTCNVGEIKEVSY